MTIWDDAFPHSVASELVPFEKVRVVLRNAAGLVVVDKLVDFPSNASEVELAIDVPLSFGTGTGGEAMSLALAYVNAAGDTVFSAGPLPVTVAPTPPGGQPPPPVQVEPVYRGPGAGASSVRIAPRADTVVAGDAFAFTASALDAQLAPIANTPIAWSAVHPTLAPVTSGLAGTGTTLAGRGTAIIVARLLTGQTDSVLLVVRPKAALIELVSGGGQTGAPGGVLAPIVVRVKATDGLPMQGVTVSFASAIGSVSVPSAVTDLSGLASVTWTLGAPFGTQSMTASAAGLTGSPLTVTASVPEPVATQLVITQQPTSATEDVAFTPLFTVEARDAQGALVTPFTGSIELSLTGGTAGAQLVGTRIVNAVGGVATFPGLAIDLPGSGYLVQAQSAGLTVGNATAFNVSAQGGAVQLAVVNQPSTTVAGQVITPPVIVHVYTSGGPIIATGFNGPVSIDLNLNPGGSTLSGTLTVNAVNGVATFGNLSLNNPASGYRLRATSPGLLPAFTTEFDVTGAGPATQLAFLQEPSTVAVNAVMTPAVTVRALDVLGNLATSYTGAVTIAIASNPGSATLGGTLTVNAVAGVATFADLQLDRPNAVPGPSYALAATALGLGSVGSAGFTVTGAGPATQLEFLDQPTSVLAGAIVSPAVTVRAKDVLGNVATNFTGPVTIAIANNPGGATLGGTLTVNAVAGVATFANLSLNAGGVGYTLSVTSAGLTGTTSSAFTVTVSALTNLWVNATGGTWSAPANWSQGRIPSATDSVEISLNGTYTVTMDVNFTGFRVVLGGGTGTQTLQATGRTISVSDSLVVRAGAIANFAGVNVSGVGALGIDGRVNVTATSTLSTPVKVGAAGTLSVLSSNAGGSVTLTAAVGIANSGDVEIRTSDGGYTTTLAVTSGALVNDFTGQIVSVPGTGNHTLAAQLDNRGTLLLTHPLTLSKASAAHLNSGTIALTTQNLGIAQTGTTPSFTNTGSITLAAGRTLTVTGGALDLSAGTLVGDAATLSLTNVALTMTPATARTRFDFNTGSSLTSAYTIPVGDSLRVFGGTLTAPGLTVLGRLAIITTSTINAPVTTAASGVIEARSSNVGSSTTATIATGFENLGVIQLTTADGGYTTTLAVTTGTLVNQLGAQIVSVPGTGNHTLAAQLDNRGTLLLTHPLTLSKASAAHLNSGTIALTTQNLTVTQSGTTPSFTNTGSITLASGRLLTVSGGALNLSAGTLAGDAAAALSLTNVALTMNTANVTSRVDFGTGTTLAVPLNIPVGDSLRVNGGTIAGAGVNVAGTLYSLASFTITAPLTTATTGVIDLQSTSLTTTQNWTNNGILKLSSNNGGLNTSVLMAGATLTNAATGTIEGLFGAGGGRVLTVGTLDNLGTLNVNAALTLGGILQQRGAFTVPATRVQTVNTLNLQPGSNTSVLGTLNVTTCNKLGGTIGGGGVIPASCLP